MDAKTEIRTRLVRQALDMYQRWQDGTEGAPPTPVVLGSLASSLELLLEVVPR